MWCLRFNWGHFILSLYLHLYIYIKKLHTHVYFYSLFVYLWWSFYLFIFLAMEFSWKCFSGVLGIAAVTEGSRSGLLHPQNPLSPAPPGLRFLSRSSRAASFAPWDRSADAKSSVSCMGFFKPVQSLCGSWHLTLPPEMFLLKSAPRYSCAYIAFFFPTSITSLHWRRAAALTVKFPVSCG